MTTKNHVEIGHDETAIFGFARTTPIHCAAVYGRNQRELCQAELCGELIAVGELVICPAGGGDDSASLYVITSIDPQWREAKRPYSPAPQVRRVQLRHLYTMQTYNERHV